MTASGRRPRGRPNFSMRSWAVSDRASGRPRPTRRAATRRLAVPTREEEIAIRCCLVVVLVVFSEREKTRDFKGEGRQHLVVIHCRGRTILIPSVTNLVESNN